MGTAVPRYQIAQEDVLRFMIKAHGLTPAEAHRLRILYRASGLKTRYSVLPDYQSTSDYSFYPNTPDLEPFPTTRKRQQKYRLEALTLALQAAEKCLEAGRVKRAEITHLVSVTCTGLYAPGLDIELVYKLGLSLDVKRTAINFMGCYAAFNALKVADAFCRADPANKVLIVCTELCSLHFQKENTEDNKLSNALFGDGAAAVIVEGEAASAGLSLSMVDFKSILAPSGINEMAWDIGDTGFEMKLSAHVPRVIEAGIAALADRLRQHASREFDYYAIHPGGKRILQVVEDQLNIPREKNTYSYHVLRHYGNMSSPTILFVLNEIRKHLTAEDHGKSILSFAFGPGLTMESVAFLIQSA